jgi:hypothetical protein
MNIYVLIEPILDAQVEKRAVADGAFVHHPLRVILCG